MTDTRPGEISRIANSDIEFRVETLTSLARMEEWMKGHDKRDDERFAALGLRVSTVSSSVADTDGKKQQLVGMWKAITLAAVCVVAGGGFVLALLTYLHEVAK